MTLPPPSSAGNSRCASITGYRARFYRSRHEGNSMFYRRVHSNNSHHNTNNNSFNHSTSSYSHVSLEPDSSNGSQSSGIQLIRRSPPTYDNDNINEPPYQRRRISRARSISPSPSSWSRNSQHHSRHMLYRSNSQGEHSHASPSPHNSTSYSHQPNGLSPSLPSSCHHSTRTTTPPPPPLPPQPQTPTCVICLEPLIQARQYACHNHMACLRCINQDLQSKLQPYFSSCHFDIQAKTFQLVGHTVCPICRSLDTAVHSDMANVFELPKEIQQYMFSPGKVHRCAFCDHPADTYDMISAHGERCNKRKLTCPECHQLFIASGNDAYSTHVMNECNSIPCVDCHQRGTYAFARSHTLTHAMHKDIQSILQMTANDRERDNPSTMHSIEAMSRQVHQMSRRLLDQRESYIDTSSSSSGNRANLVASDINFSPSDSESTDSPAYHPVTSVYSPVSPVYYSPTYDASSIPYHHHHNGEIDVSSGVNRFIPSTQLSHSRHVDTSTMTIPPPPLQPPLLSVPYSNGNVLSEWSTTRSSVRGTSLPMSPAVAFSSSYSHT